MHASDEMKQELEDQVDMFRKKVTERVAELKVSVEKNSKELNDQFGNVARQLTSLKLATSHEVYSRRKFSKAQKAQRPAVGAQPVTTVDAQQANPYQTSLDESKVSQLDSTLTPNTSGLDVTVGTPSREVYVGTVRNMKGAGDVCGGYGFIECAAAQRIYQRDVLLRQVDAVGGEHFADGDEVSFVVESRSGHPRARQVCKWPGSQSQARDRRSSGEAPPLPPPSTPLPEGDH